MCNASDLLITNHSYSHELDAQDYFRELDAQKLP